MNEVKNIGASEAKAYHNEGNRYYTYAQRPCGNISPEIRVRKCREGQCSYAIIITWSDSRVTPKIIFLAKIGGLFVIRAAGNFII